jgi:hypothetical protein
MNHHDDISAAIIRKLTTESGIAPNTAMLPSTKERGAVGARCEKIFVPFFTFCYG